MHIQMFILYQEYMLFFFSSRRRHMRCALVTGVQTCALPIYLFEAFRIDVTAHAASEEMSLYATMLANPDLRDEAQHSVAEHKEIEDYLTELYEMDFASTGWLTRFRPMKDRYLHPNDEAEGEMFQGSDERSVGKEGVNG